jgi:hypothetical protein
MRWIWRLLGRLKRLHRGAIHLTPAEAMDQEKRLSDAHRLVAESEKLLESVDQRAPKVQAHANEMRQLRRENGFAAIVYDAFRGVDK